MIGVLVINRMTELGMLESSIAAEMDLARRWIRDTGTYEERAMKILNGVVGEGMGHAIRSGVVIEPRDMRAFGLSLILALLSVGCGESVLPARPVVVEVDNQSTASVYLAGDKLSFHILDGGGQVWRPDTARAPLCSRCDEVCDGTVTADPIPIWIEVPAGGSISLAWEGRLYRRSETGCRCGWSCFEPAFFADGDYELVVEYELELPEGLGPYDPLDMGDGVLRWRGSEMGTAEPGQTRTYPITFEGQSSIAITFAD